eukprot:scaffold88_cov140-Isochrysis_galbana.AAC.3
MIDSPTDTALTKGRERSAPGMSHADTHTPLHGPTGGVPSDKALSDTRGRSWTDLVRSPDVAAGASSCKGPNCCPAAPLGMPFFCLRPSLRSPYGRPLACQERRRGKEETWTEARGMTAVRTAQRAERGGGVGAEGAGHTGYKHRRADRQ